MLIEGEINFETGIHESDLLASLVVEGGILPSAKKHYLQKGFLFHCGFGSRLMKFYMAMGAREHHAPRSLRNIWQEPFHKNRKRNPPRVTISCYYAARWFHNHRLCLLPELLTSARNVLKNEAIPPTAEK